MVNYTYLDDDDDRYIAKNGQKKVMEMSQTALPYFREINGAKTVQKVLK